jgi:hypothetical protein
MWIFSLFQTRISSLTWRTILQDFSGSVIDAVWISLLVQRPKDTITNKFASKQRRTRGLSIAHVAVKIDHMKLSKTAKSMTGSATATKDSVEYAL